MKIREAIELQDKIKEGVMLAYKRLIAIKQKENGQLVFSENGKVIVINAREIDQKIPAEESG
jgi:hypothetical protein